MQHRSKNVLAGLVGGVAGLAAMQVLRWLTKPIVRPNPPRGTEAFATDRSMSLVGIRHRPAESATDALARIGYEKILRRPPSPRAQRALSYAIHYAYGLCWAGIVGALLERPRHPVRTGALLGAALWLFGDELAVPLLGLADKPTAYHPTQHLQSLLQHLGFGISAVSAARAIEDRWN